MRMVRWTLCSALLFCLACNCKVADITVPTTLVVGGVNPPAPKAPPDLRAKPLPRIQPGTVIGEGPPRNWSNLVIIATPTVTASDLKEAKAPKMASHYAQMFKFTVLANVVKRQQSYSLDVLARGFAMSIPGRGDVIVEPDKTFGGDLGLFGQRILDENMKMFDKDVLQVVRTETMLVFDAKSAMRVGNQHRFMVIRHAILVFPETGQLATLIWLMANRPGGYDAAEQAMQLIPPNMHEKRELSFDRAQFTFGIPKGPEAIALVRIPQGTAVQYTQELVRLATVKDFTPQLATELEVQLRAAVKRVTR